MPDFFETLGKALRYGQEVNYGGLERELGHLRQGLKREIGESTQGVRRDLAEALLLLHGLVELLIRRGLISKDELKAMMDEIDLRDGELNGYLDPMAARGEQPQSQSLPVREFLRQLSQQ